MPKSLTENSNTMKRISIINGPNLNLLGKREPEIYGNRTFEDYLEELRKRYPDVQFCYRQSNVEGTIVDYLQEEDGADGIILNAAAYTHTSIAIADAVKAIGSPVVEVHISNIFARETERQRSILSSACKGCISGFGLESYALATEALIR